MKLRLNQGKITAYGPRTIQLMLRYDDDGEKLHPGDLVQINHEGANVNVLTLEEKLKEFMTSTGRRTLPN